MQCSGELLHSGLILFLVRRGTVQPTDFPYLGNALALYGLCNDDAWLALNGLCTCKSRFDGVEIVSVDGLYVKAESLELLVDRFRAGNFTDRAVNLQAVEVDNQAEIIEVVVGCKHSSFPNLTLFNLAIAEQRVNTVIFVINLAGKRHACRSGNA